jgi:N6-adenosine-specific RNA methylase IME4/ParB-like chromosome segregation protein Spo0J
MNASNMPPIHPAANLFPMLPDAELRALADDIKANGLQQPIVMYGAHLLDGRNRWRACEMAGVEIKLRDWQGTQDQALRFVISLNLNRRHLDESQRAMVAARIATMRRGDNQHAQICATSRSSAAELLSVAERSVTDARKVIDKGTPELAAAVDAGRVAVSTAALIADEPQEQQRELVARGEKEILARAKELRADKAEKRRGERIETIRQASVGAEPLALGRRFPVIYADPPWQYDDANSRGAAEDHYPTMPLVDICGLPITEHATDDAVLLLWATSALLPQAFEVMKAWGFEYRSSAVWVKSRQGLGHWFRVRHELLLVGVRGKLPPPAPSSRPDSVVLADLGEHSEKPEEFYALIERMWPELPRLELFARSARAGWERWGNQANTKAEV